MPLSNRRSVQLLTLEELLSTQAALHQALAWAIQDRDARWESATRARLRAVSAEVQLRGVQLRLWDPESR